MRQDTATGKTSRQTVHTVTSLTSAQATAQNLDRLIREHWSLEAHYHVRGVSFSEDAATNRTGCGCANLAAIRAVIIAALKDADYLPHPKADATTTPAKTLRLRGLD